MKFLRARTTVSRQHQMEQTNQDHISQSKRMVIASYILRLWRRRTKSTTTVVLAAVDTTPVLPDTDSFRISLILPTLSARFSLLRERSSCTAGLPEDDGVLACRRRSRTWFAKFIVMDNDVESQAKETRKSSFEMRDRSASSTAWDASYGGDAGGTDDLQEGRSAICDHSQQVSRTDSRNSEPCDGLTLSAGVLL